MRDADPQRAGELGTRQLLPDLEPPQRPQHAVVWAAVFNFAAFLIFGSHVAQTVGTGIVSAEIVDPRVVFGALMGAISWNIITWALGIPSSSSHALIGGLVGAGTAKVGISAIVWGGLAKTSAAIVLSPLMGFVLAMLLFLLVSWLFVRYTPHAVDQTFRSLQFASASLYSLGHGGNDAQKTIGVITVLLYSQGYLGGDQCSVRVRVAGELAWLNVKSKTLGTTRSEYEFAIPVAEGQAMGDKAHLLQHRLQNI